MSDNRGIHNVMYVVNLAILVSEFGGVKVIGKRQIAWLATVIVWIAVPDTCDTCSTISSILVLKVHLHEGLTK